MFRSLELKPFISGSRRTFFNPSGNISFVWPDLAVKGLSMQGSCRSQQVGGKWELPRKSPLTTLFLSWVFKGRLASLFALAKFVIDEQFLRKILLITYQKKCSNCYTMFYSNFLFACLFLSSNHWEVVCVCKLACSSVELAFEDKPNPKTLLLKESRCIFSFVLLAFVLLLRQRINCNFGKCCCIMLSDKMSASSGPLCITYSYEKGNMLISLW